MNQAESSENNQKKSAGRLPKWGLIGAIIISLSLTAVVWWLSWAFQDLPGKYIFVVQSILNILIFTAIAVQALIYHGQWSVMQDSLRQTGNQLAAMHRQIDMEYTAQRPWLFLVPDPDFTPSLNTSYLKWQICNSGKTTARVINAVFQAEVGRMVIQNLPALPDYRTSSINFFDTPLAPNGKIDAFTYLRIDGLLTTGLSADHVDRLARTDLDLVIYGFVKYSDSTGEHESRTCFYWANAAAKFWINIQMPEPAEYHRCT